MRGLPLGRATIALAVVCFAASILQVAVATAVVREGITVPVLPLVVILGWSAVRRPDDAWLAVIASCVAPAAVSSVEAGWFLMALLPGWLLAAALPRGEERVLRRSVPAAAAAAFFGGLLYWCILALATGEGGYLVAHRPDLAASGLIAAAATAIVTLGAWPLRPRRDGLFA